MAKQPNSIKPITIALFSAAKTWPAIVQALDGKSLKNRLSVEEQAMQAAARSVVISQKDGQTTPAMIGGGGDVQPEGVVLQYASTMMQ